MQPNRAIVSCSERIGRQIVDTINLQRYKRLLLAKRQELSASALEAYAPVPSAGGWQGDLMDQASADVEAELQIRLHQSDLRLARAIEEALGRIKQGTYGICEGCRHPIPRARLNAVPWTRLCRACKEQDHLRLPRNERGRGWAA